MVDRRVKKRKEAENALAMWLSAALDDPLVCVEMKQDIERWFAAIEVGHPKWSRYSMAERLRGETGK